MSVTIQNISKSYDGKPVLQNFSQVLQDGGVYCFMGPSGAGKTTLLRILLGLEKMDSGCIHLSVQENETDEKKGMETGKGCRETGSRNQHPAISAVFQENRLLDFADAIKNIRFVEGTRGLLFQPEEILKTLLEKEDWYRPVRELSGGMQRRVAIGRALAARSEFLLMDEPFTGLDEGTKERVIQTILKYRNGRTLLVVTHQEEDIQLLGADVICLERK